MVVVIASVLAFIVGWNSARLVHNWIKNREDDRDWLEFCRAMAGSHED